MDPRKKPILCLLIIVVSLILFSPSIYSQDTSRVMSKGRKLFIGFSAGPVYTGINSIESPSLKGLKSENRLSFSRALELGYFFSHHFGISTGIIYSPVSTSYTLSTYSNKYTTTDSEMESYERRISGSEITEDQASVFINVPLSLDLQFPVSRNSVFFINAGISLSYPLSGTYKSRGIFSFSGYYPAYNVLLYNLPTYGFQSDAFVAKSGDFKLKKFNTNAIAATGIRFFVSSKVQISILACYSRSLSTISDYPSPQNFQLATDISGINSVMGGSESSIIESIGFGISIRYYLK